MPLPPPTDYNKYKRTLIRDYLEAQIGSPIIGAIDQEINGIQRAINLALPKYWEAFPYVIINNYQTQWGTNVTVNVADIIGSCITDPTVSQNAYFLGVTRIDSNPVGPWASYGMNIDSYLLGVPVYQGMGGCTPTGYGETWNSTWAKNTDYTDYMLYQTQMAMMTGEIEWQISPDGSQIIFITPWSFGSFGQMTVFYGFGFLDSAGMMYLRPHQLDLFRKMAAVEFLNLVLSARGQIRLNTDFTLDMGQLASRRDLLQAEVTKTMADQAIFPLMWG